MGWEEIIKKGKGDVKTEWVKGNYVKKKKKSNPDTFKEVS